MAQPKEVHDRGPGRGQPGDDGTRWSVAMNITEHEGLEQEELGDDGLEQRDRMRVGIVDDHVLMRDGVAYWLVNAGYERGASAKSVKAFLEAEKPLGVEDRSNVVILDVQLSDDTTLEGNLDLLDDAGYESVVILTTNYESRPLRMAMERGVHAIVAKNDEGQELLSALAALADLDDTFLSPYMAQVVAVSGLELSPVLDEVLTWYTAGLSAREVGEEMNIAEGTVTSYLKVIKIKYLLAMPELLDSPNGTRKFTRSMLQKAKALSEHLPRP
jgi:DNA-binding NarL/FixJ family response regulator